MDSFIGILARLNFWRWVFLIGMSVLVFSICTFIFMFFKLRMARSRVKVLDMKTTPRKDLHPQIFVEVLTTSENLVVISPTVKGIEIDDT